jgi:hypothetical protein
MRLNLPMRDMSDCSVVLETRAWYGGSICRYEEEWVRVAKHVGLHH